jgi:DNA-directed RNA polymerase specialized sigma subunit
MDKKIEINVSENQFLVLEISKEPEASELIKKIVESNYGLIEYVIVKNFKEEDLKELYKDFYIEYEDIFNIGVLGLLEAVKTYNYSYLKMGRSFLDHSLFFIKNEIEMKLK